MGVYQGPTQNGTAGWGRPVLPQYQGPSAMGQPFQQAPQAQQQGGFGLGSFLPVIGGLGSALGSLFAPDQKYAQSYDVNPGQRALWDRMYGQWQQGAGDFGGGSATRSGYAALQQMLGARGIDPRSGAAMAAMSNVASQGAATDAANRRQWGQGLLNSNIQQATRYV